MYGPAGEPSQAQTPCPAAPPITGEFAPQGIDVRDLSKTVKPGDDFFTYVNDGWLSATPIPDGHWDFGETDIVGTTVDGQVKILLTDSLAHRSSRGSAAQDVGDAYASLLDTGGIEKRGLSVVKAEVARIMASTTKDDITRWMADPTSSSIVAINVYAEAGQPLIHLDEQNLNQPIMGLWNPDTYTKNDGNNPATREAYKAYIASVLEKAGVHSADVRADRVLALETQMAGNLWPLDKLRDRKANYHPMTVAELSAYAPGFPWQVFLAARGAADVPSLVLGTDTSVQAQAKLFAAIPLDDWKAYLAFHWIQNQIDVLPADIRQASWDFYGKTLSSAKSPPARDDVAMRLVSSALAPQVGRLYAERYVNNQTRDAAEEMIGYLRKAFAERLTNATWMDDATRAEAQAKLNHFVFKVGYPKIWRDYTGVDIRRDAAAGNLRRLREADWAYQVRRLTPGAVDEIWYESPQTVDASYSVLFNSIEIPGAFLQPPFFSANADSAVNFGAIGATVGHEMGHGFDDQGIIYDSQGRMRNWWSDAALTAFHDRSQAMVDQFNAYSPYPGVHGNGQRDIGENIADLSGVSLAYRAYHMYLADHPCAGHSSVDGLTGDQRFFESWAQAWRYKAPESAIRYILANSYQAPATYRVNGVVANLDEWYKAFGVTPGDKLYILPEKRVRIW